MTSRKLNNSYMIPDSSKNCYVGGTDSPSYARYIIRLSRAKKNVSPKRSVFGNLVKK